MAGVEVASPFFYDEDFVVREFHPGDVIDVVKHFSFAVYVEVGVVFKAELFLFQACSINFNLGFVFSDQLEQDAVVAFKVFVDLLSGAVGGFSQVCVVVVFAADGAEYFICSSAEYFFTYFTGFFHLMSFVASNISYSFETVIIIYSCFLGV